MENPFADLSGFSQEDLGYLYRQSASTQGIGNVIHVLGCYGYTVSYLEGEHYQLRKGEEVIADVQSLNGLEEVARERLEEERRQERIAMMEKYGDNPSQSEKQEE